MNNEMIALVTPVHKMSRDMMKALRQSGGGITDNEARFMVDLYYQMQEQRVRVNNQVKGLDRDAKKAETNAEPHDGLDWTLVQFNTLEKEIAKILKYYTESHEMAWFFEQTLGIGPILAAGLLAHIDIAKAPTVGHIWRFAGLDPSVKWRKGEKRPWNTPLKTLCWKIGESFIKVSGRPDAVYGQIYRDRKQYEWERNLAGGNANAASQALSEKNIGKNTDAFAWYAGLCSPDKARAELDEGRTPSVASCKADDGGVPMIPPAQIDRRAARYAVKMFLSHLQHRWWEQEYGEAPPKPYVISHMGHAHYKEPPQVPPK